LALVGEIEMLLQGRRELDALDAALEHLRERSGAEVGELFLAGPDDREVFLVSHQGPDLDAFSRRDRFSVGEGLPGMVLSSGASLITERLPDEQHFLRSRVKALGYTSAICTPLDPDADVSGSMLLTWKDPSRDTASMLRLAVLASVPIGKAIDLMRAHLRLDQLQHLASHGGTPLAGNGHPCLRVTDPEARVPDCPAERASRIQVLGVRKGWPTCCREAGCTAAARYCIPLRRGTAVWAVATVAFRTRPPIPHTRHLPRALWLTEDLAPSATDPAGASPAALRHPDADARLRIRCFGGFTISLDGQPLDRTRMRREKARELLALLVVASGRPRSLEYLAQQLWPDVPVERARNRFHVTLSALRSVIEPADAHDALHLRRDGQRYFLDPASAVSVDAWHFDRLIRTATAAGRSTDHALVLLDDALALYSGELLAGEFTAEWPDDIAAHYRDQVVQAAADLAEARLKRGQVSQALAVLRQAEEITRRPGPADPRLLRLRAACMQRQTPLVENRTPVPHG